MPSPLSMGIDAEKLEIDDAEKHRLGMLKSRKLMMLKNTTWEFDLQHEESREINRSSTLEEWIEIGKSIFNARGSMEIGKSVGSLVGGERGMKMEWL